MAQRPVTLDSVPDEDWDAAVRKAAVLAPLAELESYTTEQIDKAAVSLQLSRPTVYRWLAHYKQDREASSLLPETRGRKRGSTQLSRARERIVQEAIRGFLLYPRRPSVAALHRSIAMDCFQAGVPKPVYQTIRARLQAAPPQELVRARQGARAVADKFSPIRGNVQADRPLELVHR